MSIEHTLSWGGLGKEEMVCQIENSRETFDFKVCQVRFDSMTLNFNLRLQYLSIITW